MCMTVVTSSEWFQVWKGFVAECSRGKWHVGQNKAKSRAPGKKRGGVTDIACALTWRGWRRWIRGRRKKKLTYWSSVLHVKLIVAQLVKIFTWFTGPECSLPCLQKSATGACPGPVSSNVHFEQCEINVNIIMLADHVCTPPKWSAAFRFHWNCYKISFRFKKTAVREFFSCNVVQYDTILFDGPFSGGRYNVCMHVTKQ